VKHRFENPGHSVVPLEAGAAQKEKESQWRFQSNFFYPTSCIIINAKNTNLCSIITIFMFSSEIGKFYYAKNILKTISNYRKACFKSIAGGCRE
jgi:hypothetical protein